MNSSIKSLAYLYTPLVITLSNINKNLIISYYLNIYITSQQFNMADNSPNSSNSTKKMYFKFTELDAETALNEINTYTNDFDPIYKISPEFKDTLTENINGRETTQRGFLNVPQDPNIIRQVIGRGGCYFHMTTQNTGIDFIWHDRSANKFFFWGTKYPLIRAMNIIHKRLEMVSQRMATAAPSTQEKDEV